MAVGLPIISVLSFSAPSTQTNDNCLPTSTTSTTTVAPETTTTTTTAPSALRVIFLGEILFDGAVASQFSDLGTYLSPADAVTTIEVCETETPTNCTSFIKGTSTSSSNTLVLSTDSRLTLTGTTTAGCGGLAILFGQELTNADELPSALEGSENPPIAIAQSRSDISTEPGETTNNYSNTDTVYLVYVQLSIC
jgi:hypothetical protein